MKSDDPRRISSAADTEPPDSAVGRLGPERTKRDIIRAFLLRSDRPIFFVIASAVAASLLTLWLAPKVDESFEKNRRESELILGQVSSINDNTNRVLTDLAEFVQYSGVKGRIDNDKKSEVLASFTTLQWEAVELATMPETSDLSPLLLDYQESVTALSNKVYNVNDLSSLEEMNESIASFALTTANLNRELYKTATR